ncbi:MAG: hypothetical protein ACFFD4_22990 [Candidatus Odinarchaeota archaeon]
MLLPVHYLSFTISLDSFLLLTSSPLSSSGLAIGSQMTVVGRDGDFSTTFLQNEGHFSLLPNHVEEILRILVS